MPCKASLKTGSGPWVLRPVWREAAGICHQRLDLPGVWCGVLAAPCAGSRAPNHVDGGCNDFGLEGLLAFFVRGS